MRARTPAGDGLAHDAIQSGETLGSIIDDVDGAEEIEEAIDATLFALTPRTSERVQHLSAAFDAEWNAIEFDIRRAAFLVGVQYGLRLTKQGGAQ